MKYLFKNILLVLIFIVLSFTKGWMVFLLILVALPGLLIWLLLLSFFGRKDKVMRDKTLQRTGLLSLLFNFAVPGVGDTSSSSAFTIISTTNDSPVSYASYIVMVAAFAAFLIVVVKYIKFLLQPPNKKT